MRAVLKLLFATMLVLLAAGSAHAQGTPVGSGATTSLPELLKQLTPDHSATERLVAAEEIAGYGINAVPALIKLLGVENDGKTRAAACLALTRIGPEAVEATPVLMEVVLGEERSLSNIAIVALGRIGPGAKSAVPLLISYLREAEVYRRQAVITSLAQMGPAAIDPLVAELLNGKELISRISACKSLETMGPVAAPAIPSLLNLSRGSDPAIMDATFLALAGIGAESVTTLRELLESTDSQVVRRAAMALGRIGQPAAAAIPRLRELLQDEHADVRFWSANALGCIGPEARLAMDDLAVATRDEDADVRWQAAVSLRAIQLYTTVETFVTHGQDSPAAIERISEPTKPE